MFQIGALAACGLTLPRLLEARALASSGARTAGAAQPGFGKAKSCILLFQLGGPSQLDTFDMKPDAPVEVRGEFSPIATSVAGTFVCEHLPLLARQMHRIAVVRNVSHSDTQHNNAAYATLTSFNARPLPNTVEALATPRPDDHPAFGAVLSKLRGTIVPWVSLPFEVANGSFVYPGQTAGFLGPRYEPLWLKFNPNVPDPACHLLELPGDLAAHRLQDRRMMLRNLDRTIDLAKHSSPASSMTTFQARALDLLTSQEVRRALRVELEDPRLRDRYGRAFFGGYTDPERPGHESRRRDHYGPTVFGQSCLLARRLVEARVPLVAIYSIGRDGYQTDEMGSLSWDTHWNNFSILQKLILPVQDAGLATLLDDLAVRGLLDETLVVWFGEFGRSPKINAQAGREHWPYVYSMLFAGAGIRAGVTFGASDKNAAYPVSNPVSLQDVGATIYHCLGIDPVTRVLDLQGRPVEIACGGTPLWEILV
jgi:hypothetical protein